jgi:hypothetical protein
VTGLPWLRVAGQRVVTQAGEPVLLRGVGVGGWLNMENFITGYPATESLQREAMRRAMGEEAYQAFFRRFSECFFGDADARYLASLGANCVRLPVNYRLLLDDTNPMRVRDSGLAVLDVAVATCAAHGLYTVLDLHALPGGQNAHWHSDNPTHRTAFWEQRVFQDRVAELWQAIAGHFGGNPAVAGYNPINEPADPTGAVIGPVYARLADAIRRVDPRHILFLDGNRYGTDQGVVTVPPGSAYVQQIAGVLARKRRLGTDSWGGDDSQIRYILEPIEKLFADEFADFDPYPWGARPWIARIVREILLGEPLVQQFGRCFAGLSAAAAAELAESFAFLACRRNEQLAVLLRDFLSERRAD